jgi:AAA family ATP:ADP antiporter
MDGSAQAATRSPVPRLARLLGDVRPGEWGTVALLLAAVFVAMVGYYVLKVVREPLVLVTGGSTLKSYAAGVQAALLLVLVPVYSRLAARVSRERLVLGVVAFFVVCTELFYLGERLSVPYLGFAFYVWTGLVALALLAQVWSLTNDLYGRETGERLIPLIAIGAPVGSVVGSYGSKWLIDEADATPAALLQLAAGLLALHLGLYVAVLRRAEARLAPPRPVAADDPAAGSVLGGFTLVARSPYLRTLAATSIVLNLVNTNGEFILSTAVLAEAKRQAVEALAVTPDADASALVKRGVGSFYGGFYTLVNVVTLSLQVFVAARLVRVAGIAGAVFALPLVALGGYAAIAAGASLAVVRLAKVAENATDYSIMNTARALVWLPTQRAEKYAAKQAVDTFFVRFGDVLSAGAVWAGTTLLGFDEARADGFMLEWTRRAFAGGNLVLVAVWLTLCVVVVRSYRRASVDVAGVTSVSADVAPPRA